MNVVSIGQVKIGENFELVTRNSEIDKNVAKLHGASVTLKNMPADHVESLLSRFGEYADGIKLDAKNFYSYTNTGDIVQLTNETTGKNVISVYRNIGTQIENAAKDGLLSKIASFLKQI